MTRRCTAWSSPKDVERDARCDVAQMTSRSIKVPTNHREVRSTLSSNTSYRYITRLLLDEIKQTSSVCITVTDIWRHQSASPTVTDFWRHQSGSPSLTSDVINLHHRHWHLTSSVCITATDIWRLQSVHHRHWHLTSSVCITVTDIWRHQSASPSRSSWQASYAWTSTYTLEAIIIQHDSIHYRLKFKLS